MMSSAYPAAQLEDYWWTEHSPHSRSTGAVRSHPSGAPGSSTWPCGVDGISWISLLENSGHPDRALAACSEATAKLGDNAEWLRFVVPFLARVSRWQEAEEKLTLLEKADSVALFRDAAVEFYRLRGDLKRSIEHAKFWVQELPRHMPARYALADLVRKSDGASNAIELALRWFRENPDHAEFEELYYRQLGGDFKYKRYSLLFRRVGRDPQDGWAWRELAFLCIEDHARADGPKQTRLRERILTLLAACDRVAPEEPATIRVHARWHEVYRLIAKTGRNQISPAHWRQKQETSKCPSGLRSRLTAEIAAK